MTQIAATYGPSSARWAPEGWIASPAFDLVVFSGSALAVLAAWAGYAYWALDAGIIIALVAVFSNGPHLTATWTRAWLDARERNARPFAYIAVPIAIAVAVTWTGSSGQWGMRMLMSVVVTWATWHFAAQCYGLLRIYQRKSGEEARLAHRVEAWLLFAAALAGFMWRLHYGPARAFGYRVLMPAPPHFVVVLCMAVVATLVVALVVDRLRPGTPLAARRLVFIASVFVGLWVPFMLIEHGSVAFAAAAGWHGLQYLGVVWLFNQRKYGSQPPQPGQRLVSWVSQPGRGLPFMGLLWAMAGSVYLVVYALSEGTGVSFARVAALTWTSLTLGHYWLDGLIWKMRKPEVSAHLV